MHNYRFKRMLSGREPMSRLIPVLVATVLLSPGTIALGDVILSTGADGPLHVTVNQTLVLPPDGVFNFTTITIDAPFAQLTGVLTFERNAANTPVFLRATGDVVINGTINVSAPLYGFALGRKVGGPGGGDGGDGGVGATPATNGDGPSPGLIGGQFAAGESSAGGGGGLGTAGLEAIRHTGSLPGAGGAAVPFPDPLTGGSGGAGGSGAIWFGLLREGGFGGGAGGAIRIDTPASIIINGSILANGAWGGLHSPVGNPKPGGGGSGGVIELHAGTSVSGVCGLLEARGGPGGGISTLSINDPNFSSGADGGLGYIRIHAAGFIQNGTIIGVEIPGGALPACPWDCDGSNDGVVNVGDLLALLAQYDTTPCAGGGFCDFDCNGCVDVADVLTLLAHYDPAGVGCP